MKFIHHKVRLNASITQGMRYFLMTKEVNKWLGQCDVESKVGGGYNLDLAFDDVTWKSHGTLVEKEFEKRILFNMMTPQNNVTEVEVYFMPCTSKTEYCTEIHLMHRHTGSETEFMDAFWRNKLDILRQYFNKDWVIEDRDLVLSVLKGGL